MPDDGPRVVFTERPALWRRATGVEAAMWRGLLRWVRTRGRPKGPGEFGHAGSSGVLWVLVAVAAVEIPILHLILPWRWAEVLSLVVGVYGLVWMLGLVAAMRTLPHLVTADGLRVRGGLSIDVDIPWAEVVTIRAHTRVLPPGRTVLFTDERGLVMHLAVAGQTNVDVVFHEPRGIRTGRGLSEPVRELRFWADDADGLVAHARAAAPA